MEGDEAGGGVEAADGEADGGGEGVDAPGGGPEGGGDVDVDAPGT
jgi:hypothetical protein